MPDTCKHGSSGTGRESDTATETQAGGPDVSIFVVSYNTREMTLACLTSVLRETREVSYELIVVDNASNDGSAEAIAKLTGPIELIASPANLGFARANNIAAERARGRFILLLNPDTVILDRAIDRLAAFAWQRPTARLWGGRTRFADGRLNAGSCWGRMTPWNLFCRASGLTGAFPDSAICNGEGIGGWNREGVRDVDIVSGCFLLIERELWDELDGFDTSYFMYGEDADLCLRATVNGARPAITSSATIVHHGGASEPTREGKMIKLLTAKTTLVRRHWHPVLAPLGVLLIALWPLTRALALRLGAFLTGNAEHDRGGRAWQAIWSQRNLWLAGYPIGVAKTFSASTISRPAATAG